MKVVRSSTLLALLTVAVTGGVQFGLFFSNKPVWQLKLGAAGLASMLGGIVLGLSTRAAWPLWCLGAAWGGLLSAGMLLFMREPMGWTFALTTVGGSLLGGLVGTTIRRQAAVSL